MRGEKRKVWRMSTFALEEITTLDAGSRFGQELVGTQLPTLQAPIDWVLTLAPATGCRSCSGGRARRPWRLTSGTMDERRRV